MLPSYRGVATKLVLGGLKCQRLSTPNFQPLLYFGDFFVRMFECIQICMRVEKRAKNHFFLEDVPPKILS